MLHGFMYYYLKFRKCICTLAAYRANEQLAQGNALGL